MSGSLSTENYPVVGVSWRGAAAFCNWLSEMDRLPTCYDLSTWTAVDADPATSGVQLPNGWRLPTEAEWERAVAWDGTKHWIYGMQSDTQPDWSRCNCLVGTPLNYCDPMGLSSVYTSPVGWFDGRNVSPRWSIQTVDSPSPAGCYDMSGNVKELCNDVWAEDYYTTQGPCVNPTGPDVFPPGPWVCRGGEWNFPVWYTRTALRSAGASGNIQTGFRIARFP